MYIGYILRHLTRPHVSLFYQVAIHNQKLHDAANSTLSKINIEESHSSLL